MRAVEEGLGEIDLAAIAQDFRERLENLHEHTRLDPLLHTSMTRLVRRYSLGSDFHGAPGPENPEDSFENTACCNARASLAVLSRRRDRDQRLDNRPLLIGELHVLLDHAADRGATFLLPDPKSDRAPPTRERRF